MSLQVNQLVTIYCHNVPFIVLCGAGTTSNPWIKLPKWLCYLNETHSVCREGTPCVRLCVGLLISLWDIKKICVCRRGWALGWSSVLHWRCSQFTNLYTHTHITRAKYQTYLSFFRVCFCMCLNSALFLL